MCLLDFSTSAQTPPGTDIQSWATANITPMLSFAGMWTPVDTPGGLAGPFWSVVKLGPQQREGAVLGVWGFELPVNPNAPDSPQTRAAILEQYPDGTLEEASQRLLGDPATNGVGSIVVADFNGDRRDDIMLAHHSEYPILWKASTAFMSRPDGSLAKIILPDAVADHDATLFTVNGVNKVIAKSFSTVANRGAGNPLSPGFNVVYTWNGSNFSVKVRGNWPGMSVVAGRFGGGDDTWVVVGDGTFGPGIPGATATTWETLAWKFNNDDPTLPYFALPKPYFNNKPEYAHIPSAFDPNSKTHTPRVLSTDLNQDGLPDIVALSTIWSGGPDSDQKNVYQLLLNHGNMAFTDDTDALAPEFSKESKIDYSTRLVDVDGSGIDTFFIASRTVDLISNDAVKQGQYILVNDGTGRLYAAMHPEFRAMASQIAAFAAPRLPGGMSAPPNMTPQFIPFRTPEGAINFLAVLKLNTGQGPKAFAMVNVPLRIDLRTDFRRDLTIPTRNGSRRIRTFAGNDTIYRALSDPDCTIDGGLGDNVVVYPGPAASWSLTRAGDQVRVRPAAGPGGTDTLTRIQIARFSDRDVNLTQ